MNVPADAPGRGLTKDKLHFLTALPRIDGKQLPSTMGDGTQDLVKRIREGWTGAPAPAVRLLPGRVPLSAIDREAPPTRRSIPIGIAEHDLKPVYLDFTTDPHFIAFGDVESGKSGLLRGIATGIMRRYTAQESAIIVVDYRRGLLDAVTGDHLLGYAGAEPVLTGLVEQVTAGMQTRLPGPDVTAEALRTRSWWHGPEVFVLVDDYELVATAGRNPLAPLLEYLPQARDIGLHLILTRRSGGAGRAMYEKVLLRLNELSSPGLIMSGSREEGALIGNVRPSPMPPGRGRMITRREGSRLVQLAWQPPPEI
jgi:S-DNA-T family DNA segregation ATPase FtsK/SpoIIIE